MASKQKAGQLSANALMSKRVWMSRPTKRDEDAQKKMGRVHAVVFHPTEARCVGLLVKRPDVALMFHRSDLFVAFNGFSEEGNALVLNDEPGTTDRSACKALAIDLDSCVIWLGLAVMSADGTSFGTVGDVVFDAKTGRVDHLVVSQGATANTLLGTRHVPAAMIRGFKRGMGTQLYLADDDDERALGALLVDEAVKDISIEGGVAETAGEATAVIGDKAKKSYKRVVKKVKPKAQEAGKVASEAIDKGVYVTGRQIGRTKGMFGKFKDEFKKGMNS